MTNISFNVAVLEGGCDLAAPPPHSCLIKTTIGFQNLVFYCAALKLIHYHVQVRVGRVVNNFVKLNNIGVLELLKGFQLCKRTRYFVSFYYFHCEVGIIDVFISRDHTLNHCATGAMP